MILFLTLLACTKSDDTSESPPDDSVDESQVSSDSGGPDDSADDSPQGDDTQPPDDTAEPEAVDVGPLHFARRPRNVILVSIDTLRYDRINAHGYTDRVTTPALDDMIANGVELQHHVSCSSWTFPSALCLLTGQDQMSLGIWPDNSTDEAPAPTPDDVTLLAERFSAAGYHTMLAGASGFFGTPANMAQGYDAGSSRFEDANGEVDAEQLADEVEELLAARDSTRPFLLHVHFLDPHMPYNPPDSYLTELATLDATSYDLGTQEGTLALWRAFSSLGAPARRVNQEHLAVRYDAAIRYADDTVAAMLTRFGEMGLWEDTVLVFFVDHGEEFYEHGNFNHGYTAYEEVVRSTAVFYAPGNLAPGAYTEFSRHEDLLPTLAAVVDLPVDPAWTGAPLGEAPPTHLYNLSYRGERTVQSVRDGDLKLVYRWDGLKELYDLGADPGEDTSLYDASDPRVQGLWELLLPEVERLSALESGATPVNPGP